MSMNKAFVLKREARAPQWRLIDAEGKVLGRLATQVADILRGKDKATYTPHTDSGDYVVIINADKVVLTGNKLRDKEYKTNSGWLSGLKIISAQEMQKRHPGRIIEMAVRRMLPKNRLSGQVYKKLKVYEGTDHPHKAQVQPA